MTTPHWRLSAWRSDGSASDAIPATADELERLRAAGEKCLASIEMPRHVAADDVEALVYAAVLHRHRALGVSDLLSIDEDRVAHLPGYPLIEVAP